MGISISGTNEEIIAFSVMIGALKTENARLNEDLDYQINEASRLRAANDEMYDAKTALLAKVEEKTAEAQTMYNQYNRTLNDLNRAQVTIMDLEACVQRLTKLCQDNKLDVGNCVLAISVEEKAAKYSFIIRAATSLGVPDMSNWTQGEVDLYDNCKPARNNKISAIKYIREQLNMGLKEAKDFVEGNWHGFVPVVY
jgi:ribosomal protein L7/L12